MHCCWRAHNTVNLQWLLPIVFIAIIIIYGCIKPANLANGKTDGKQSIKHISEKQTDRQKKRLRECSEIVWGGGSKSFKLFKGGGGGPKSLRVQRGGHKKFQNPTFFARPSLSYHTYSGIVLPFLDFRYETLCAFYTYFVTLLQQLGYTLQGQVYTVTI